MNIKKRFYKNNANSYKILIFTNSSKKCPARKQGELKHPCVTFVNNRIVPGKKQTRLRFSKRANQLFVSRALGLRRDRARTHPTELGSVVFLLLGARPLNHSRHWTGEGVLTRHRILFETSRVISLVKESQACASSQCCKLFSWRWVGLTLG